MKKRRGKEGEEGEGERRGKWGRRREGGETQHQAFRSPQ